jgi:hypothetical protein
VMHVIGLIVPSAVLIAIGGALFGISLTRVIWAEDLLRTQELKVIWKKTEMSLEDTIKTQREHIQLLQDRLNKG